MGARVVTSVSRPDPDLVSTLQVHGVATVHEALGRRGLLDHRVRPRQEGARIAGPAVTCEVAPGDNWMIHVALEQARPGDVLVVSPTSPCDDGYFGDLLATSAMARGVRALVIDAGVRDVADLRQMGFPVWSKSVSAQGCVKATLSDVQTPLVCAGVQVRPGDVVVADDDGVCVVAQDELESVADLAVRRAAHEENKRLRYASGELSLDVNEMRNELVAKGLRYV